MDSINIILGEIWQSLSGSIFKKELYPLEYRNIVKESNDETTLASEEIERVSKYNCIIRIIKFNINIFIKRI